MLALIVGMVSVKLGIPLSPGQPALLSPPEKPTLLSPAGAALLLSHVP